MLVHVDCAYAKEACASKNQANYCQTNQCKYRGPEKAKETRKHDSSWVQAPNLGAKGYFWGLAWPLGMNFRIPTTQVILEAILVVIGAASCHDPIASANKCVIKDCP